MAKPKPISSEDLGQPKDMAFAHFGVLNDGTQSKTSTMSAVAINVLLAFVVVVVGAATKKTIDNSRKLTELTMPIPEIKKVEPPKPRIVPPKMPKLPEVPKIEVQAPKIVVPDVKVPEPPKPVVKMEQPKPVIMPAPPKAVVAMAAPKPVAVNLAANAAVVNNSQHPAAVALGSTSNPIAPSSAQVSNVNLGNKGMSGMPPGAGMGAPSRVNLAGSGQPGGSTTGTGPRAVTGLASGVIGGTGPLTSRAAGPVNLAVATPPPMPRQQQAAQAPTHSAPKVIYKPKPEYTEEAKQAHVEGTVTVHIHVLPNGSVQVVGVTDGLGHGLDESARRAALATKFEPATDASGHPIEWDGFVKIAFQLAG